MFLRHGKSSSTVTIPLKPLKEMFSLLYSIRLAPTCCCRVLDEICGANKADNDLANTVAVECMAIAPRTRIVVRRMSVRRRLDLVSESSPWV